MIVLLNIVRDHKISNHLVLGGLPSPKPCEWHIKVMFQRKCLQTTAQRERERRRPEFNYQTRGMGNFQVNSANIL
jgi:hypothetical protein